MFLLWLSHQLKYGLLIFWPPPASRTVGAIYETHEIVPPCVYSLDLQTAIIEQLTLTYEIKTQ